MRKNEIIHQDGEKLLGRPYTYFVRGKEKKVFELYYYLPQDEKQQFVYAASEDQGIVDGYNLIVVKLKEKAGAPDLFGRFTWRNIYPEPRCPLRAKFQWVFESGTDPKKTVVVYEDADEE